MCPLGQAQQVGVGAIEFKGNRHFSAGDLKAVIATRSKPWYQKPLFWKPPPLFDEETLLQDLLRIERFYHQEGYLEARVVDYQVQERGDGDRVRIVIQLEEGEPTRVSRVDFYSTTEQALPLSPQGLAQALRLKPGKRYREEDLRADYERLITRFNDAGYPYVMVRVRPRVNREQHTVALEWLVTPGPFCRFGEIRVVGNRSVSEEVIRRGLGFSPGKPFAQRKLAIAQSQVYRLELFQFVSLRALELDQRPTEIPIEVRVKEATLRSLKIGAGWGSEEAFRGFVRWRHRNFFGGGRILALNAQHSSKLLPLRLELELGQPYFLDNQNDLSVKPFFTSQDEPAFKARRFGLEAAFTRQLTRRTNFVASGRVERNDVDVKATGLTNEPEGVFNKNVVRLGLRRNSTNELFSPSRGSVAQVSLENAGLFSNAQARYLKLYFEYKKYKAVRPGTVVAWRLQMGAMGPIRGSLSTPVEERFYSGGSYSVRGWARSTLGPQAVRIRVDPGTGRVDSTIVPIGGNSIFESSVELRFPILSKLTGAVFVDVGGVWPELDSIDPGDLRYALGAGLRYETVVGPIRLDWGYKVNKQPLDRSDYQIHVTLGQAF